MTKSARFQLGTDVWICDCGAAVLIGRVCGCGKTYADILTAENVKSEKRKSPRQKLREPAETRKFTESYLFRKGQNK